MLQKLVSYYCVNDDYKFAYGAQVKFQVISCSDLPICLAESGSRSLEVALTAKKGRIGISKANRGFLQYDNVRNDKITLYDIQQD
jgi:hypothetical protein